MYLVVGLGNPGKQYADTRHNIGFRVVESLAARSGASLKYKTAFDSLYAKADLEGQTVHFLLPQTYMNNSGRAVLAAAEKISVLLENIIVVHDEIDLPPAAVKIKTGGGAAGHNGLRSIMQDLGSGDFTRIRVGIGKPDKKRATGAEYVLSGFLKSEKKAFKQAVLRASDAAEAVILLGAAKAMNSFNRTTQEK